MSTVAPPLLTLLILSMAGCGPWGPRRLDTPSERRFERFVAEGDHSGEYEAFVALLTAEGVADVVPPWHLWRQGTDWRGLDEPAFAVPPREAWPAIVPTLRVIRDDVVPRVGPVEVVSGFRTEVYNARADGAKGSRHKWFEAVDVVPEERWERDALHVVLLDLWTTDGPSTKMGLGLYGGTRFHIDTHRHRKW
jgi:hypothetical protein